MLRIPNIFFADILPSKMWRIATYVLSVRSTWWLSSKEGKKGNFSEERHDKHHSARWLRSISTVVSHVISTCSLCGVLTLVGFLLKTCNPTVIMRNPLDKSQFRDTLQYMWPLFLKFVKVTQNKESLRNWCSPEDLKETRQLNVMWSSA